MHRPSSRSSLRRTRSLEASGQFGLRRTRSSEASCKFALRRTRSSETSRQFGLRRTRSSGASCLSCLRRTRSLGASCLSCLRRTRSSEASCKFALRWTRSSETSRQFGLRRTRSSGASCLSCLRRTRSSEASCKQFEEKLFSSKNTEAQTIEICRKRNKKVNRQGYSIQCASCRIWFHQKCTPFSVEELRRMRTTSWTCGCEVEQLVEAKLTGRYVDDVIRSAKTQDVDQILEKSNKLHTNLEFTVERLDNGSIPFLDMLVTLQEGKASTAWYQKPTDTGLILSFMSLAPTIFKKNIIQGTVHRIFNATTKWQNFDDALCRAQKI